ncbi:MAG: CBS domain-containing protein [Desulfovibrio sp.]|nr:MAG: CBS domain-containing protein [Desulfovibrio sp.]
MYVGLKMLTLDQFVTISPNTLVADAEKLMEQNRLWMLMVVDEGKLVGYVRKEDCLEALPSRATTLSKHELNYLLAKLTVEKVIRTDVPTAPPEMEIEEAAHRMYIDDIPGLAVVDPDNKLLGYINRSVMLELLVEEMGLVQGGSRIVFGVEDRTGVIHEVSGIIAGMGVSIIATGTFFHNGSRIVVFRVKTDNPEPIVKAIEDKGYTITGPETFASEWS